MHVQKLNNLSTEQLVRLYQKYYKLASTETNLYQENLYHEKHELIMLVLINKLGLELAVQLTS